MSLNFHLAEQLDADQLPPDQWVSCWRGGYLRAAPETPQEAPPERTRAGRHRPRGSVVPQLEAWLRQRWPMSATHLTMATALECHVDLVYAARKVLEARGHIERVGVVEGARVGKGGGRREVLFRWRRHE